MMRTMESCDKSTLVSHDSCQDVHYISSVCVCVFHVLCIDRSCASMSISGFQTYPSRELNLLMSAGFKRLSSIRFYGPGKCHHDSVSRHLIDKWSWVFSGGFSQQPSGRVCLRVKLNWSQFYIVEQWLVDRIVVLLNIVCCTVALHFFFF